MATAAAAAAAKGKAASAGAGAGAGASAIPFVIGTVFHAPVAAREKAAAIVTDPKEWNAASGLQDIEARYFEDQLSGAAVSVLKIETLEKLQAKDLNGLSDPYFVLWMSAWPHGALKTPVVRRTLEPVIETSNRNALRFPLTNEALAFLRAGKLLFHAEVWDQDPTYDDFMGWTNCDLGYGECKSGLLETCVQIVDGSKPAGVVRLTLWVDVESPAPPQAKRGFRGIATPAPRLLQANNTAAALRPAAAKQAANDAAAAAAAAKGKKAARHHRTPSGAAGPSGEGWMRPALTPAGSNGSAASAVPANDAAATATNAKPAAPPLVITGKTASESALTAASPTAAGAGNDTPTATKLTRAAKEAKIRELEEELARLKAAKTSTDFGITNAAAVVAAMGGSGGGSGSGGSGSASPTHAVGSSSSASASASASESNSARNSGIIVTAMASSASPPKPDTGLGGSSPPPTLTAVGSTTSTSSDAALAAALRGDDDDDGLAPPPPPPEPESPASAAAARDFTLTARESVAVRPEAVKLVLAPPPPESPFAARYDARRGTIFTEPATTNPTVAATPTSASTPAATDAATINTTVTVEDGYPRDSTSSTSSSRPMMVSRQRSHALLPTGQPPISGVAPAGSTPARGGAGPGGGGPAAPATASAEPKPQQAAAAKAADDDDDAPPPPPPGEADDEVKPLPLPSKPLADMPPPAAAPAEGKSAPPKVLRAASSMGAAGTGSKPAAATTAAANSGPREISAPTLVRAVTAGGASAFAHRYNESLDSRHVRMMQSTLWTLPGRFAMCSSVAVTKRGDVYACDLGASCIRTFALASAADGFAPVTRLVAGKPGSVGAVDGPGSKATFNRPNGICVDPRDDSLIVADSGNCKIRRIRFGVSSGAAMMAAAAAAKAAAAATAAAAGAGGAAAPPVHREEKHTPAAAAAKTAALVVTVSTMAGSGANGHVDGSALECAFRRPGAVAWDTAHDRCIVADAHAVRVIARDGTVSTLAGSDRSGYNDGPGATALFCNVSGVCVNARGEIVCSDTGNNAIRSISPEGVVSTVSGWPPGTGKPLFADGAIKDACFNAPSEVCIDVLGNVIVADSGNKRIRCVGTDGHVTTLAGTGTGTTDGSNSGGGGGGGGPVSAPVPVQVSGALALTSALAGAYGVTIEPVSGHLLIADGGSVHQLSPDGKTQTLAMMTTALANANSVSGASVPVARRLFPPPARPAQPRDKRRTVIADLKEWGRRRDELVRAAATKATTFSRFEGHNALHVLTIDTIAPLLAKDMNGLSDPYLVVWLSAYGNGLALQTPVCDKTLVPAWDFRGTGPSQRASDSAFVFPLNNASVALLRKGKLILNFEVWDRDPVYDDFMGFGNASLRWTDARNGEVTLDFALVEHGTTDAGALRFGLRFVVE